MNDPSRERHRRVVEVFHAALERPPEERGEFLGESCGEDGALRDEVESLLVADDRASDFIEEPAYDAIAGHPRAGHPESLVGERVGSFRLVKVLGTGGMGTVYEALQENPRRTVAVKMLQAGALSANSVRRFTYESEFLARLRHPGIAHIYEVGVHGCGGRSIPYFAMEHIPDAQPITHFVESHALDRRSRLALFVKVCEAVHHGHQRGVIHRDLKPANILVDSSGRPKIIDFGVARAIDRDIAATTAETDVGKLVGTLQYMSPEQCTGESVDLDIRSDVYSLGMILYELLTGELPYQVTRTSLTRALRVIQRQPPQKPSQLDRRLKGDIEVITLKALEKDRERRYASASSLAEDCRRYLDREPITARPPSFLYLAGLHAGNHKAAVGAVSAVVLILIGAALVSMTYAYRAGQERNRRELQAYIANISAADSAVRAYDVPEAALRLENSEPRLRNWEWAYLHSRLDLSACTLGGEPDQYFSVAYSASGSRIVSVSRSAPDEVTRLSVWDASTREVMIHRELELFADDAAFSPDERWLGWTSEDGSVSLWDLDSDPQVAESAHSTRARALAFGAEGRLLATASQDGHVLLWRVPTLELLGTLGDGAVKFWDVAIDPAGARLAAAASDGTIRMWDLASQRGPRILEGHTAAVRTVAFSPDGSRLVSGSNDTTLRVWEVATGKALHILGGHRGEITSVAIPGAGEQIVSGSVDGTLKLWDTSTGLELSTLWGHRSTVLDISASPTSPDLVSCSRDGTLRIWDMRKLEATSTLGRQTRLVRGIAVSPDDRWLACASADRTIKLYDLSGPGEEVLLEGHEEAVTSVAFSPDSGRIASASNDGSVKLWDVASRSCAATLLGHSKGVHTVAISPAGRFIASGSQDGTVLLWDEATQGILHTLPHEEGEWLWDVAFSPGGDRLATASGDGVVKIWEIPSGVGLHTVQARAGNCVAFSPDGERLATGSDDGSIRIWDVESGRHIATCAGHSAGVWDVCYSPDGSRIASASLDSTIRLWDSPTAQQVLTLRELPGWVWGVAFTSDGRRIVAGGGKYAGVGCFVRIWESGPPGLGVPAR